MAPAPPVAGLVQKDAGTGLFDPAAIPVGFVAELDAALAGPGLSPSLGVSGPGAAAAAPLPSAVQPDAVMRQIAAQADAAAPPGVEIELDPPELGRIRLMLSPAEAGLTAQLQIERPETLELLRRHAELLLRELAEAGFPDAALSFDLGADAQDRGDTPMPQAADTPRPPAWEQPGPAGQTLRPAPNADHAAPRPEGGRGLDIRL
ncbi:MAG: flagellar hook-length control protein FliK [Pseudomonadota bacterium]